ncbi:MAG TPA: homoserine dehydrogenase [Acidimicrobiales bacterium]
MEQPVRVGLLGCGGVGSALVRLIGERSAAVEARTGLRLAITRVAVRDIAKTRPVELADGVLTDDAAAVVADPDVDVVVELIGGVEPARSLLVQALRAGKPVVTANKELLAVAGSELFEAAAGSGVDLLFEAAVGGGIPIIRPLRESLVGERVRRITGIVNGTTNYILTRMSEDGAGYADALGEAQRLGFAEPDPTADVEGLDAGAKLAIVATIAFGASVVADDVHHEGISSVTADDIGFAHRLGYEVKLLAIAEQDDDGRIAVRVHPAMVPRDHPLATVRDAFNAVFVEGDAVGPLMFYGRGAGGEPTASALLGDLVDAATNLRRGGGGPALRPLPKARIRPVDELRSEYYLDLEVLDEPGVLHAVSGVFAEHGVSIRSMEQEGLGDEARLVFITHEALEASVQATLAGLRKLDVVDRVASVVRVLS